MCYYVLLFISGCVSILVCFFFFKQKTAYEMRISDWSSDVCSSDLMHLHEIYVDIEGSIRLCRLLEKLQRSPFDIAVEIGNADHALVRRIDVLAVDLEILGDLTPGGAGERALRHLLEHRPQLRVHVGKPGVVRIGVGVEVVETDVLHDVVAVGVRQGVVGLAKVPLAGEIGVVTGFLQDRRQGPLGSRQTATLALESHGGQDRKSTRLNSSH